MVVLVALLCGLPGLRHPGISYVLVTEQEAPKKFICMEQEGGLTSRKTYGATQLAPYAIQGSSGKLVSFHPWLGFLGGLDLSQANQAAE